MALIDRGKVMIDYLENLARKDSYKAKYEALSKAVDDAPTVDAEVVRHGYWIPQDSTRTKFMCSDCKSRNHDGSGKYCSLCGCKMDAEVER